MGRGVDQISYTHPNPQSENQLWIDMQGTQEIKVGGTIYRALNFEALRGRSFPCHFSPINFQVPRHILDL